MAIDLIHDAESDITLKAWQPEEAPLFAQTTPVVVAVDADPGEPFADNDRILRTETFASSTVDARVEFSAPHFNRVHQVRLTNPSVAEIEHLSDSELYLRRLADGSTGVILDGTRRSVRANATFSQTGGGEVDRFHEFAIGSAARGWVDQLVAKLAQYDHEDDSARLVYTGTHTRNPNCWLYDLTPDLTCIAYWNDKTTPTSRRRPTLLTRDCCIYCRTNHVAISVGTVLGWTDNDNVNHFRTVTQRIDAPSPQFADFCLYRLDEPLPASIAVAKILPPDWRDYFPGHRALGAGGPGFVPGYYGVPLVAINLRNRAHVSRSWVYEHIIPNSDPPETNWSSFDINSLPNPHGFQDWSIEAINGDSGSPVFVVLDGQLVLTRLLSSSVIERHRDWIADTLVELESDGELTEVDLSGYTNYAEEE